jgi:acyl carrier protein
MTKDEVLAVIAEETGFPVNDSMTLGELELDSLELMNLLVALGIPDADIEELDTVADLIAKAA